MDRLSIACVPTLLVLAACVHDGSGSHPAASAQPAQVPATPALPAAASKPPPAVQRDASASAPAVTPPAPQADSQSVAVPAPPRTASPPPSIRSGPTATKVPPAGPASVARAGPAPPAAAAANTTRPAAAAPAASVASVAALDLNALEQRLRDTHAIGVFTKLSLKNQVDDLLTQFKAFYRGQSQVTLAQLRQNYEVLLLKVVSVLQEGDPGLASAVSSSREAIWGVLKDPKKFATI
jgi:hypothetical protein